MRKYIYVIISTLFALVFASPLGAAESTMVFERSQFNFGKIKESDGLVSHTFTFTNKGTTPIVIENVATSCGCTTPEYSRKPIKPDQTSQITISYDPEGRPGRFSREVIIVSNNRQNKNTLTIKGVVEPKELTLEDEYIYLVDGGLRLSSMMANFMYLEHGKSVSKAIGYVNPTDQPLEVSVVDITGAPAFNVTAYPSIVGAGEKGSLTLSYDIMDNNSWGYVVDKFYLVVNGQKNKVPISTSGIIVEKFDTANSAKKHSPQAVIKEVYYDLGNMKNNNYIRKFTVANSGTQPLVIQHVELPEGFSTTLTALQTIEVGQEREFEFKVDVSKVRLDYMDSQIIIILNEPSRPMRKIHVIGYK